jgi:hypothetical protein
LTKNGREKNINVVFSKYQIAMQEEKIDGVGFFQIGIFQV